MPDDHVFLIAVQVRGDVPRAEARSMAYAFMDGEDRDIAEAWWDAGPDATDGNDNDRAVFVHNGRWTEAARMLRNHGLTSDVNLRVGEHPELHVERNDEGEPIAYVCGRCNEHGETPADLVPVPCRDLSLPEHAHYWEETGTSARCLGCDLEVIPGWTADTRVPQYLVLDQNGTALLRSWSWPIVAAEARQYGPAASVWDHDTLTFQITGQSTD